MVWGDRQRRGDAGSAVGVVMNDLLRERLRAQLTRDEGKRTKLYHDTRGISTIGIGHNLTTPISEAAIRQIFYDDLQRTEILSTVWPFIEELSEARQGVCYNMAFQMGVSGFLMFTKFRVALEQGDYGTAAREMEDSTWAQQTPERAQRLVRQLVTDTWQ